MGGRFCSSVSRGVGTYPCSRYPCSREAPREQGLSRAKSDRHPPPPPKNTQNIFLWTTPDAKNTLFVNWFRFAIPAEALGSFENWRPEVWRLGDLERLRGLECRKSSPRASKIEAQGFQNGIPGLPKWSPGHQKWLQVGQKSRRMVVCTPQESQADPGKQPGEAQGSQNESQGVSGPSKNLPKWCQNGVNISSKRGSDSECSKMSISHRCLGQLSIKKTGLNFIDSAKTWCLDWQIPKNATFTKHCKNQCEINFFKVSAL